MKLKWRVTPIFIMVMTVLLLSLPVYAAEKVEVAVNQSQIMNLQNVERVAIANPLVADVIVASSTEVLVVGKAPGITTLHVWSSSGRESYEVEVGASDVMIAKGIKSVLGYPDIEVSKVDKTVILEGTVNDQYQRNRAEKVAGAYGEKVVNMLEITRPIQVKIEARIVEISKDKLDKLGIKWGNTPDTAPGVFSAGQSKTNTIATEKDKFRWFGTYADINAQVEALLQNGYAKILSQPSMITMSGEKASILVGGEIPIPVSIDDNKITVEWKEYGIKLNVEPEVNSKGLITSKVKAEVSSIDYTDSKAKVAIGNGLVIPALKTRKAETVIAMVSGQTMAIGGLISSEDGKTITKIPLLSDLPIIGRLFTSTSFMTGKTEIVILMTPTLINPAKYEAPMTIDMKDFVKENPWSVKKNDGNPKNK